MLRRKAARRAVPIAWALVVAEALVATKRHLDDVPARTRRRLLELVKKSKGRPSNLTREEKRELTKLVGELRPFALGRTLVGVASPVRVPGTRPKKQP